MLTVSVIRTSERLETLEPYWNGLAGDHWMRSWRWQKSWIDHYSQSDKLRILVAWRDQVPVGIMPLAEERRAWTGRTLQFVGNGRACLDDLGILATPEDCPEVAGCFAEYLFQDAEFGWDYMELDGVRALDPSMQYFSDAVSDFAGVEIDKRPGPGCWELPLQQDAEGFPTWPKRIRSLMRKGRKARADGEFEVRVAATLEEALQDLAVIQSMHQARWNSKGCEGCFADQRFTRFIKDLLITQWDQGTVHIPVMTWGGVPAAGLVCFRHAETLSVYLTAMSQEFEEQKPGWKLNGCLADDALASGYSVIDYMRGDEVYKQRLGAKPVQQDRWMIAAPKISGRLRRAIYESARGIKQRWNRASTVTVTDEPAS